MTESALPTFARVGTRNIFTATLQTADETTHDPATALPTSEPGTAQASYTVASGDLPEFSSPPSDVKYIGFVYLTGRNLSGSIQTVNYASYNDTVSVKTGSRSINNDSYWTVLQSFYDIEVGDVLELAAWCDSTDMDIMNEGYQVGFSRIQPESDGILYNVDVGVMPNMPVFTGGNPYTIGKHYSIGIDMNLTNFVCSRNTNSNSPLQMPVMTGRKPLIYDYYFDTTYGSAGGQNVAITNESTVYYPYYTMGRYPDTIAYNVIDLTLD